MLSLHLPAAAEIDEFIVVAKPLAESLIGIVFENELALDHESRPAHMLDPSTLVRGGADRDAFTVDELKIMRFPSEFKTLDFFQVFVADENTATCVLLLRQPVQVDVEPAFVADDVI